MTNPPVIYLAGAIRDHNTEDIAWRAAFIEALTPHAVVLNPLGGKSYDARTKTWTMSGMRSTTRAIVAHDAWCVDQATIVVANLLSLSQGYPSIGTLMELGRAWARGTLIYLIVPMGYTGHENAAMWTLHPFLADIAAATFPSSGACLDFLRAHVQVLNGSAPHFGGAWTHDCM